METLTKNIFFKSLYQNLLLIFRSRDINQLFIFMTHIPIHPHHKQNDVEASDVKTKPRVVDLWPIGQIQSVVYKVPRLHFQMGGGGGTLGDVCAIF